MSLVAGETALESTLAGVFSNTTPANTAAVSAQNISNGMMTFAQTGVPMTVVTGIEAGGQPVAGGVTAAPGAVTATGTGGIDVPAPGSGLAAAKAILMTSLTTLFSNTTPANTAPLAAQQMSQATLAFLSQAMVLTNVTAIVPPGQVAPPPAGPVGPGAYTGTGTGGIDSSSPGMGLAAALPDLIANLTTQFSDTTPGNTVAVAAQNIADYLESFFLEAMITTTDTGTAVGGPASVAPPPSPPVGSTLPPGSPSTGTGTGLIS